VRVEVAQDDGGYLKPSSVPSTATIHGVRLTLHVREPQRGDFPNAAKFCDAQRSFLGIQAFGERYGANRNQANALGKCVSRSN
jgi:hypothetical protein